MWIFSRIFKNTVDRIIAKEVSNRRNEIQVGIAELDKIYDSRKREFEIKIADLDMLRSKIETETKELERVRVKAEEEQKRLWERLDILRDNLNTEDVWIKLWECAYSKAIDAVWPILQKENLHLIELAENRAYIKAKEEFEKDLSLRMSHLTNQANGKDSVPFIKILAIKKLIEDRRIVVERMKNSPEIEKCAIQLEIIGRLL